MKKKKIACRDMWLKRTDLHDVRLIRLIWARARRLNQLKSLKQTNIFNIFVLSCCKMWKHLRFSFSVCCELFIKPSIPVRVEKNLIVDVFSEAVWPEPSRINRESLEDWTVWDDAWNVWARAKVVGRNSENTGILSAVEFILGAHTVLPLSQLDLLVTPASWRLTTLFPAVEQTAQCSVHYSVCYCRITFLQWFHLSVKVFLLHLLTMLS